jgi:ABC-type sugar transport system permease subunit
VAALFRAAYLILLFDPIFILTFGGPSGVTETIGFYTYLVGFKFFRMGYAAAISYILLIITILISLGILRLQREVVK